MNQEKNNYSNVLSSFRIKSISFPNRIYFPPFGIDMANADGCFSDDLNKFYSGVLSGGYGLVIIGNASVSEDSTIGNQGLQLCNIKQAAALKEFVQQNERHQSVIGIQLQHYGGQGVRLSKEVLLSPSAIVSRPSMQRNESYEIKIMTQEDIDCVKQEFVRSAILACDAGIRYIQLQASNGYLLSSFISPLTNHRKDRYPGKGYHPRGIHA